MKVLALPDSNEFLITSTTDIRLTRCNLSNKQFSTLEILSDLGNIKCVANSDSGLIAVGNTTGKITLIKLDSTPTTPTFINLVKSSSKVATCLNFSQHNSALLAIGLDKSKSHSLLVYDITTSAKSLQSSSSPSPRAQEGPGGATTGADQDKIVFQTGAGEGVHSTHFIGPSPILLASLGKKLRAYDIRSPSTTPLSIHSNTFKIITQITPSPFSTQTQFACIAEDEIKLIDLRSPASPLLSFSTRDAGSVHNRSTPPRPIIEMKWSPKASGTLAALEQDGSVVRMWNILDGPIAKEIIEERSSPFSGDSDQPFRLPCLFSDQRTARFAQPLTSFAFSSASSSRSSYLVGVSTVTGGNGHRLELMPHHNSAFKISTFTESIVLSSASAIRSYPIPFAEPVDESDLPGSTNLLLSSSTPPPTLATLERNRSSSVVYKPDPVGVDGLGALRNDPCVMLHRRAQIGYGGNPQINASLVELPQSLRDFWSWIADTELYRSDSIIDHFDFRYRGVISILNGFAPEVGSSSLRQPKYLSALSNVVSRRASNRTFTITSTLSDSRKLALDQCGRDWQESFEVTAARYLERGDYEGGARHSFLSNHIPRAMTFLRDSRDERLRLLAPVLAAYLAQKDSNDGVFSSLLSTFATATPTPWIRALLTYLSSGDWSDVIDETGLSIPDRVAVALRELPDSSLRQRLDELARESLHSGDLTAALLFDLRRPTLWINYVNRTVDVQTVALAAIFIPPLNNRAEKWIERWIQTYRSALNSKRLFKERSLFDNVRGQRIRDEMELLKGSGRMEVGGLHKLMKKLAKPQIVLRCVFCSSSVSVASTDSNQTSTALTTKCPTCNKSLPRCSICLQSPTVHSSAALSFCIGCRHGGHQAHILAWFNTNDECPVPGCECRCAA